VRVNTLTSCTYNALREQANVNIAKKHEFDFVCGRHSAVSSRYLLVIQIDSSSSTTRTPDFEKRTPARPEHVATIGIEAAKCWS
jgi:hypothetical protein